MQQVHAEAMGIDCGNGGKDLANGQCTFDIYETVGIRQDQPDTEVNTFVQDIVLSATFFIGTVVAVALIYSGIQYISAKDDGAAKKAKEGVKNALIWLALVMLSYTIIRLVQYVARG